MELRGLGPNFHVHVSVSDLYILTIGLPILLKKNTVCGLILEIYKSLTDTWMWKLGLGPRNSFSGNTKMEFLLQCEDPELMANTPLTQ